MDSRLRAKVHLKNAPQYQHLYCNMDYASANFLCKDLYVELLAYFLENQKQISCWIHEVFSANVLETIHVDLKAWVNI